MNACGHISDTTESYKKNVNHQRAPCMKPPFSLSQLKKAIPPHCFQRSVICSFSYVVHDLIIAFMLYCVATTCIPLLPQCISWMAWSIYWVVQGCILTGLWVIGHECGHHAFSDYQWLDDTIGLILHSFLLVPYFSWKYSHRRHHSNIGSLEHDEVFVPKTKSKVPQYFKYFNNFPGRVLTLAITLLLGWPLYLSFNASGHYYDRFACHFDLIVQFSPILAAANGFCYLICVYGIPLLVVNAFLVLITYLQHTHPSLPHYNSSEWDWLRGALITVDRDYGVLNKVFHNITDTHVAHHLFASIPHYHAMEATKAIKPILRDYYQYDATPFLKAMWRETKECIYVESDEGTTSKGVFWYSNKF
ncbi:hypothetical protein AQUCO_00300369v1 [Aquilegia coerulea]|uniref:Fatty acid desaturase domain-containing protein n=1 Tax=Aquilegia coerulea TaxID=218851 RepID=A0A2G5EYG6_AQUCA|nr:hypothetical protein AQUCO_00300369v1 [Aquilegia coerulea]